MKSKIENRVYQFFINSDDFNGMPLRQIPKELNIPYDESIDCIKELVSEEKISIQSSTNPHIIGFRHYPKESQLKILEDAKGLKETVEKIGSISFVTENTEFPICLYPSNELLKSKRDLKEFGEATYTKQLALGDPQLKPKFFEIEVLERYSNDPRFDFEFEDYSGSISCKYDENDKPIIREEDQVFLKDFGLGFDSEGNRLAVAYLRYLGDLTPEHQMYWKSKEKKGDCKILKEYHENTIEGNWTNSYSIFSAFIGELTSLNELSKTVFSKSLFRKNYDSDNRPKEFTFFFTPTLKNYNDFVLLLDKMISDNINKDFFQDKVELYDYEKLDDGLVERKQKGTLRLLEEWLLGVFRSNNIEELKDVFKPLKKVRKERQNPAHRISENEYDKKYVELQKELINMTYNSIRQLRHIFQQHPKAKDYRIPDWLENGDIKTF